MKNIITLLFMIISSSVWAQTTGQDSVKRQALVDAETMLAAYLSGDYETFARYNHPKIIEWAGGTEKIVLMLKADTATRRMITRMSVHSPSAEIKCGDELQCVLQQEIIITSTGEQAQKITSNLIAVSQNNGTSWTFFDAGKKDIKAIQEQFPNICDTLPLK